MNIEKVTRYVKFILSRNSYRIVSILQYVQLVHDNEMVLLNHPATNPLIVFKRLFEHFCKVAETGAKSSGPELFSRPSKKHEDFFDCNVDADLEQLRIYLSKKSGIPIDQLQDDISDLNTLLKYLVMYLRQYEDKKLPFDVESDFYAMMVAFFYVYGHSLNLGCIPQLAVDVSKYIQSQCDMEFIEAPVSSEGPAQFNLPLSKFRSYMLIFPRLDNSDPHVRLKALHALRRMRKVPHALSEIIIPRLLVLLRSSHDYLEQRSKDDSDSSKKGLSNPLKFDNFTANEHLDYIFQIICSGVISIPDHHIKEVMEVLLAELSKKDSVYRHEICLNIHNLPIPLEYQAAVTEALLSTVAHATMPDPNAVDINTEVEALLSSIDYARPRHKAGDIVIARATWRSLSKAAVLLSGIGNATRPRPKAIDINIARAACISLSKIVLPENLREGVLTKLIAACAQEELLLSAAVALQRLNGAQEIQRANHDKIVNLLQLKTVELLANIRVEALSMINITEEAKAKVINKLSLSMAQLLRAPVRICLMDGLLLSTCIIVGNIAPRSEDLARVCRSLLTELQDKRPQDLPHYLYVLYKLDHNIEFQQELMVFLMTIWPKSPNNLDLFLHVEDLFVRLAPQYQATLLSHFASNENSVGCVLGYWNIFYRDVPVSEVLSWREQQDNFMRLLPSDLLYPAVRNYGP